MRPNSGDETARGLERDALTGDRQAAIRLLLAWRRSGELVAKDRQIDAEVNDELLGRIVVTVKIEAPVRSNPSRVFCDLWLRDVRRSSRLMGVVLDCRASSVSYLLERLRAGDDFHNLIFLHSVVAPTEARGTVNTRSVQWPGPPGAHGDTSYLASVAMHRTLQLLWRDPAFRRTFMEAALAADLVHRAAIIEDRARALDQAETEATVAVVEELNRRRAP